jgi:hypothetical protein
MPDLLADLDRKLKKAVAYFWRQRGSQSSSQGGERTFYFRDSLITKVECPFGGDACVTYHHERCSAAFLAKRMQ